MSRLLDNDLIQGNVAGKCFVDVTAIHTDYLLTAAEREEAIFTETAVADEKPARPRSLLVDLAVECSQVGGVGKGVLPLSLQQVSGTVQLKAAVYLLPTDPKRVSSLQSVGVVQPALYQVLICIQIEAASCPAAARGNRDCRDPAP